MLQIYILLGVLQGIFEWIPISSEGVVALFSSFLAADVNAIDLAVFLHLGTLLATLLYFRKDWREVLTLKNKQLLSFLVVATLVSLVVGYPVYKLVRSAAVGSTLLLITGLALLLTAGFNRWGRTLGVGLNWLAVIAGGLQGLSIIPGLSRSGVTIFALSLGRLPPDKVLKWSYMMSVPVILAANAYLFLQTPVLAGGWHLSAALAASFTVGLLSLRLFMKIGEKTNLFWLTLLFGSLCVIGVLLSAALTL